jgi:hypothetical protein
VPDETDIQHRPEDGPLFRSPPGDTEIMIPRPAGPPARPADPAPLSLIHEAMAKGITDPGYLEKLLSLQERWEDRNAQAEFNRAMNAAQSEMPAIHKDGENRFNKTRYATLEGVLRAVQPVYLRHGFGLSFGQEPGDREGMLRVFVDVSHNAGHSRRYYGDFPVDADGLKGGNNKTAIQAVGSAFSYARRYLLGLVFNLVFTNEDNDGQPVGGGHAPAAARSDAPDAEPVITPQQARVLNAQLEAIRHAGRPDVREKLCREFGVDAVEHLPAAKFQKAKEQLEGVFKKYTQAEGVQA